MGRGLFNTWHERVKSILNTFTWLRMSFYFSTNLKILDPIERSLGAIIAGLALLTLGLRLRPYYDNLVKKEDMAEHFEQIQKWKDKFNALVFAANYAYPVTAQYTVYVSPSQYRQRIRSPIRSPKIILAGHRLFKRPKKLWRHKTFRRNWKRCY